MKGLGILVLMLTLAVSTTVPQPTTRKDNVTETINGVSIADPYRWLEDQDSPETRAWIDAQNKYSHAIFEQQPHRDEMRKRFSELLKIDAIGTPVELGGRYFFTKRLATQDLPVLYMRKGITGADQVLLDPHTLSKDHTTSAGFLEISRDGTIVVYFVRQGGEDQVTPHFLDVDTLQEVPVQLPKATYTSFEMMPDKSGVYYSTLDKNGSGVFYHPRGGAAGEDRAIFCGDMGAQTICSVQLSEDGRYLAIQVSHGASNDRTDIFVKDLSIKDLSREGAPAPVVTGIDASFDPHFAGHRLYLTTNWKAPRSRVIAVDLEHPAQSNWKEVIPEADVPLDSASAIGGKLFATYLHNAATQIKVFDGDGKYLRDVSLPSIGTASISGRWEKSEAWLSFQSFHVPPTSYRYDTGKDERSVWAELKVPVRSDDFELKQVWYESKDKTKVPMFLLYRKGIKLDGTHPVYLTGYGGFRANMLPAFSSTAIFWAEQGGVFALPSLRGGAEFGEDWHKAGMLDKKQNVFDDFIGAAEYLVKAKYTSPAHLTISGGSNGGLLVGAMMTQRPDLFRAVMCSFPLLDMVRYQKFLIAKLWVPEYGSSDDPKQFPYIYAYSPYHHVKAGTKYPAVLLVTGDADTRVDPLHARKMTAMVQAANAGTRPIVLDYETKSGHSGGQPLSKIIEDQVNRIGFLLDQCAK